MEHFTLEEQGHLFEKICYKAKQSKLNPAIILKKFDEWFNEVRLIDPLKLKEEEIQPLIDRLINPKEYQDNLDLIRIGFFHCWYEAAKVPFLQLAENNYCESVDTDWRINWDTYGERSIVIKKITDYFTKDEQKYLFQKMNTWAKQTNRVLADILTSFTKWFFGMRRISVLSLKEDEIQPLIDKFLNSQEGRENLDLLSNLHYRFMKQHYMEFLQLTRFQDHMDDKRTDWWIKFDFAIEKYVMAKKK
jgi:hypothetical protein